MLNLYYLLILSSSKVVKIDVKQESFVDHGEITCFSMYSGPEAIYNNEFELENMMRLLGSVSYLS